MDCVLCGSGAHSVQLAQRTAPGTVPYEISAQDRIIAEENERRDAIEERFKEMEKEKLIRKDVKLPVLLGVSAAAEEKVVDEWDEC